MAPSKSPKSQQPPSGGPPPLQPVPPGGGARGRDEAWVNAAYRLQYLRLAREMQGDVRQQFLVLSFSATAALGILGYMLQVGLRTAQTSESSVDSALIPATTVALIGFFLPLFLTVPAAIIIFNRARTRNRKAAFIICFVELPFIERLERTKGRPGLPNTVEEVRDRDINLPWETALQTWERHRPHLPAFLLAVFIAMLAIELCCLAGILYEVLQGNHAWNGAIGSVVVIAYGATLAYRLWQLIRLGWFYESLRKRLRAGADTIQGYTARWLIRSGLTNVGFLDDYLRGCFGPEWRKELPVAWGLK